MTCDLKLLEFSPLIQDKMATMAMTNMFASDQLAAVGGLRPGEVTTGVSILHQE